MGLRMVQRMAMRRNNSREQPFVVEPPPRGLSPMWYIGKLWLHLRDTLKQSDSNEGDEKYGGRGPGHMIEHTIGYPLCVPHSPLWHRQWYWDVIQVWLAFLDRFSGDWIIDPTNHEKFELTVNIPFGISHDIISPYVGDPLEGQYDGDTLWIRNPRKPNSHIEDSDAGISLGGTYDCKWHKIYHGYYPWGVDNIVVEGTTLKTFNIGGISVSGGNHVDGVIPMAPNYTFPFGPSPGDMYPMWELNPSIGLMREMIADDCVPYALSGAYKYDRTDEFLVEVQEGYWFGGELYSVYAPPYQVFSPLPFPSEPMWGQDVNLEGEGTGVWHWRYSDFNGSDMPYGMPDIPPNVEDLGDGGDGNNFGQSWNVLGPPYMDVFGVVYDNGVEGPTLRGGLRYRTNWSRTGPDDRIGWYEVSFPPLFNGTPYYTAGRFRIEVTVHIFYAVGPIKEVLFFNNSPMSWSPTISVGQGETAIGLWQTDENNLPAKIVRKVDGTRVLRNWNDVETALPYPITHNLPALRCFRNGVEKDTGGGDQTDIPWQEVIAAQGGKLFHHRRWIGCYNALRHPGDPAIGIPDPFPPATSRDLFIDYLEDGTSETHELGTYKGWVLSMGERSGREPRPMKRIEYLDDWRWLCELALQGTDLTDLNLLFHTPQWKSISGKLLGWTNPVVEAGDPIKLVDVNDVLWAFIVARAYRPVVSAYSDSAKW